MYRSSTTDEIKAELRLLSQLWANLAEVAERYIDPAGGGPSGS